MAYQIYNKIIIGIDHGFGNMKTRNKIFKTGVKTYDTKPTFGNDILEFDHKFHVIGEGHKSYVADKVTDDDYYILTLAAIAEELDVLNKQTGDVVLAVGLPPVWIQNQSASFTAYLMKNKDVSFTYHNKQYQISIDDVYVYPQGYAGIIQCLNRFTGSNILADIGNGTMNTIYINNGKPDASKFYTDKLGVHQCVMKIKNELTASTGSNVEESLIEDFLINNRADVSDKYLELMRKVSKEYVKTIFERLVEYDYNSDLMKLYFIGGGGCLVKNFGSYDKARVEIIDDICATAKGYEYLAYSTIRSKGFR